VAARGTAAVLGAHQRRSAAELLVAVASAGAEAVLRDLREQGVPPALLALTAALHPQHPGVRDAWMAWARGAVNAAAAAAAAATTRRPAADGHPCGAAGAEDDQYVEVRGYDEEEEDILGRAADPRHREYHAMQVAARALLNYFRALLSSVCFLTRCVRCHAGAAVASGAASEATCVGRARD
jgi:hypothetical protein